MSWTADIAALQDACRDTFGVAVTHTPLAEGGTPQTLTLVYDHAEQAADVGGIPAQRRVKTLSGPVADFTTEPVKGDKFTIGADTYRAGAVDKDESGYLTITLGARG